MEIVIYGKPACPKCDEAKNVLKSRKVVFTYVDVTEDQDSLVMLKSEGFRSVPQIFVDGVHAGDHNAAFTVGVTA